MKREEKAKRVEELHERFSKATVAILSSFSALSMEELTQLRQKLRGVKAELTVVKNTLAVRAVEGTGLAPAKNVFKGPIAVTIGYDDPILPAKILQDLGRQNGVVITNGHSNRPLENILGRGKTRSLNSANGKRILYHG